MVESSAKVAESDSKSTAKMEEGDAEPSATTTIITEGMAKVSFTGPTFYNPVQEFNRDLTVSVLREFVRTRHEYRAQQQQQPADPAEPAKKKKKLAIENEDGSIRILDALSASGLRALRFSQEVPDVAFVLANDFSENAVETIKQNVKLNNVEDKVEAHFGDAIMTMMDHRGIDKRFHCVDLDPYGSASPFLDSAVQCVADRGLLMVTCTDMAVLCGNTPESCYNKYGAIPIRINACHELALRMLLRTIDNAANRYTRYIEPILAISVDFYVRVFVRMHTGAAKAKESALKVGRVLSCSGCGSYETIPIIRKVVEGKGVRYMPALANSQLLDAEQKCVHCGHSVHEGGPIYTAPIHNEEFVRGILHRLKSTPEEERLGTHGRLLGMLTVVSEELHDVPLYYAHDQLACVVKAVTPKLIDMRSALLNAGYRVSGSHCNARAVKTDAPPSFIWDICRFVAEKSKVNVEKFKDEQPGKAILSKASTAPVNFTLHPKAESQARSEQLVRFQDNKGKNWGPRAKAKGSVSSVKAGFQIDTSAGQQITDN
ncbi:unnamed protein product, partial [Mesorhabditis spiculigera]